MKRIPIITLILLALTVPVIAGDVEGIPCTENCKNAAQVKPKLPVPLMRVLMDVLRPVMFR